MRTHPTSHVLYLGAGSLHGLAGRPGLRVLVCEGRVALTLPSPWLNGAPPLHPHVERLVLGPGDCHAVDTAGWLQLTPLGAPARLRLLPPAPGWPARAWAQARRLLGLRSRRLDDLRPLA
ncbi:MAG: hypothetical protein KF891_09020 [Rhizobacter sp.]|nr:hypothetical protein [Rhizobacter sp.]